MVESRKLMANVVAGQFLPEGVVKGGSSIRLRYGKATTRFTLDLDTAWRTDLDTFLRSMKNRAHDGWAGFTGEIIPRKPASLKGVPFDYVMQPFDVKLSYRGQSWCTVELEDGLHFIFAEYSVAPYHYAPELYGPVEVVIPAYGKYKKR